MFGKVDRGKQRRQILDGLRERFGARSTTHFTERANDTNDDQRLIDMDQR